MQVRCEGERQRAALQRKMATLENDLHHSTHKYQAVLSQKQVSMHSPMSFEIATGYLWKPVWNLMITSMQPLLPFSPFSSLSIIGIAHLQGFLHTTLLASRILSVIVNCIDTIANTMPCRRLNSSWTWRKVVLRIWASSLKIWGNKAFYNQMR